MKATRFPAAREAWATAVVAPAMGVRQDFYAPLARFLSSQGVHALTFDWRGMGYARPARLRGFAASVTGWANEDLEGAYAAARAPAPHLPLLHIGHSLGGQLLGAAPGNARVDAALLVNAGSGWYRLNERMPLQVRVFWFAAIPLLTPLFGYFPGKALRMVGDLPEGVAWQWRRWCLHPEYLLSEGAAMREAFDRVRCPILSYSFEDDPIITRRGVDSLLGFYRRAAVESRHVAPGAGERLGHFGFFSARSRETLWQPALDWLREAAGAAERPRAAAAE